MTHSTLAETPETLPLDMDAVGACEAATKAERKFSAAGESCLRAQRTAGLKLLPIEFGTGRPGKSVARATVSDYGITRSQLHRWRLLASIPEDEFEGCIRRRLEGGRELTTTAMLNVAKRLKAQRERENLSLAGITADCGIHLGDFRQLGSMVADESVGLVFTDPPYLEETIHLYGDLAEFAERVLIPGGMLIAYTGHYFLPRVFADIAARSSLTWGHCFAAVHRNGGGRVHRLNLRNGWKPLLCYVKEPISIAWEMVADTVQGGKEKALHDWQQAQSEAEHFIDAFAPAGSLVVDPFCGSGTTLAAAKKLGRRWLGFEIDAAHAATARARLQQQEAPQ